MATVQGDCEALQTSIDAGLAAGQIAACIEQLGAPTSTAFGGPSTQAATIPDWCGRGTPVSDRTEACGVLSAQIDVFDGDTGALVGGITFNYVNFQYTSMDVPRWAHQLDFDVTQVWGYGAGSTVAADATCAGDCTGDGSIAPELITTGSWVGSEGLFEGTAIAPGQ